MGPQTPVNRSVRSISRPHEVHAIDYPVSILGVFDPVYVPGEPEERIAAVAGRQRWQHIGQLDKMSGTPVLPFTVAAVDLPAGARG